jgi:hypothetical protein
MDPWEMTSTERWPSGMGSAEAPSTVAYHRSATGCVSSNALPPLALSSRAHVYPAIPTVMLAGVGATGASSQDEPAQWRHTAVFDGSLAAKGSAQ